MSVKSFKFVSPGVFINEIDNSFTPQNAQDIGPVVVGRATRGLAMQPVTVQSYSEFVEVFGDTVPGNGGGDISRDGNFQSPMYGTYAAKAFLNANVAPLTYVRLLGQEDADATDKAGWVTTQDVGTTVNDNGGAYGMFVFKSSSMVGDNLGTGALAAVFYIDQSASIQLSGTIASGSAGAQGVAKVINSDANFNYTLVISASAGEEKIKIGLDDTGDTYMRNRLNTNPQLASAQGSFYPSASYKAYWLGETYDQFTRDAGLVGVTTSAVILPIAQQATVAKGPHDMEIPSREAVAGWFISQDQGTPSAFEPVNAQKLFRLVGRGHGEWLHKNCKISIERIKQSTSSVTDYGTFSVVIRQLLGGDGSSSVIERFDSCTLDPASPNFIARKIGDTYLAWNDSEKRLKEYGEYPNLSNFIYIEMNTDVESGATDSTLLPFGYYGIPKFKDVTDQDGIAVAADHFVYYATNLVGGSTDAVLSGSTTALTGTLAFPSARLRATASGTDSYFGFQTTRTVDSTVADNSLKDYGRLLWSGFPSDPTTYGSQNPTQLSGASAWDVIFSMNDVTASGTTYFYQSGSRKLNVNPLTYTELLNAGYDRFTAPFWGGHDGFDITKPDPMYNGGMTTKSTESTSYVYNTWKQAIDTVADPEFIDMNLLLAPGLTNDGLTSHMIDLCENRADAMTVIDLADIYIPTHEAYQADKKDRIGTTPRAAATALNSRMLNSSYGSAFYPWVQTQDDNGQRVWIPPSVAMAGVLASSQSKSEIWFAPAGFNRGGLTDGAAGIPVLRVTEKVVSKDRDLLYESRINPIASFPGTGIVIYGQKTLQERASALNRINVRRLVIHLKKRISILASQVLFEQNVQATWNRFIALIDPFLSNVQTRFGITDYKLILDESTTTPDLIDQNIMYAKIMVKPARAIEYIAIDFVITSTGASFDD
tara:strand:+ start:9780 stop:12584 length:2805 start_codon:yes stop_codon:yes gene_type:complete